MMEQFGNGLIEDGDSRNSSVDTCKSLTNCKGLVCFLVRVGRSEEGKGLVVLSLISKN